MKTVDWLPVFYLCSRRGEVGCKIDDERTYSGEVSNCDEYGSKLRDLGLSSDYRT